MLSLKDAVSPSRRALHEFGLLSCLILGGVAVWQGWFRERSQLGLICAGASLLFGSLGILKPLLLKPIFVGWMILIFPVAWLISHVLLLVVYFGIFTPVGLLLRWTGRDVLRLKIEAQQSTYWEPKPPPTSLKSYFRQF